MGNPLFGVDISGIIASAVGPGVLEAVITKKVQSGQRDPDRLAAGIPTTPKLGVCRGFFEDYQVAEIDGAEILKTDRRANLIGDTIPAGMIPVFGDTVTIEGLTVMVVRLEKRDPAAALYVFQCRDQKGPDGQ